MRIKRNHYDDMLVPSFVLCKANGDRLGTIKCTSKKSKIKFNDYNELSFTTYLYNDGVKSYLYDKIAELQYIEVTGVGRYIIGSIQIQSEGTEYEYKECIALSEEIILAQKYLEEFVINMGTTESIDNVSLYNLSDPTKSLLHLILEKYPDWKIGHVDNELYTVQRCFEITRQDVYSFLMSDVSQAFQCIFIFDTLNHRINVYKESNVGENTNIFISYDNLLKNTNISSSIDDIKTCLTVLGADDLNLREVNMGYDRIYNIDYFHNLKYMSKDLYDAYEKWKEKWNSNVDVYEGLIVQYQSFYNKIHFIESEKMPSVANSTNWSEYGLNPLKEQLASYEQKQSVMIKAGQGAPGHKDYSTMYLPCYNAIQNIKSQIRQIELEITNLKNQQNLIGEQMEEIISSISMNNNFTKTQLDELSKFIREDELSSSNFVVTDIMTDSERMDMLHEMLKYGREELSKISQPTLQFSCDMINLFSIPEFDKVSDKFETGNYIHISMRDDYVVKARIIEIEINLYDENDFNATFGNIVKSEKNKLFEDVTEALKISSSVATSVSFNSSNWNKANKDTSTINKMLADGLLAAGQILKSVQSDILIDDRGMIISNKQDSLYAGDSIFVGGGQILFSDDNLKTIKTALGRIKYTKKGIEYDDFGLLAQFVIAGYIAGSIIEGTEFINGNGTFSVTPEGYLTSKAGNIGGWEITENAIYNNIPFDNKKNSKSTGMGTYGSNWAFWAGNGKYWVNQDGEIHAELGRIGGAEIGSTYLKATNGKWQLDSSGYATLTGAKINGVDIGSTFGGVTYNGNGTYGNFNYGFNAGHGFGVSGGALSDFKNLVVDSIEAKQVLAQYIKAEEVAANYATIGSLNAANARIDNLSSASINVNRLTAGSVNGHSVSWKELEYVRTVKTTSSPIGTENGKTYYGVTGWDFRKLYVMAEDTSI